MSGFAIAWQYEHYHCNVLRVLLRQFAAGATPSGLFLERDLPQLGVNESTVRRHLDWLTQTFMVRRLQPWFENLAKRQVKSPKIYFRDSGLLHALLGIADEPALLAHPKSGASWEAFALEQTLELAAPDEAWFWATHAGAELDLLMMKEGRRRCARRCATCGSRRSMSSTPASAATASPRPSKPCL